MEECGNHTPLWMLIGLLITLTLGAYAYTAALSAETNRELMVVIQGIARLEMKQEGLLDRFNAHLQEIDRQPNQRGQR